MRTINHICVLGSCLGVLLNVACSSGSNGVEESRRVEVEESSIAPAESIPSYAILPSDASDVKILETDHFISVYFVSHAPYPNTKYVDGISDELGPEWQKLPFLTSDSSVKSSHETGWISYRDPRNVPVKAVRQWQAQWLKGKELINYRLVYSYPLEADAPALSHGKDELFKVMKGEITRMKVSNEYLDRRTKEIWGRLPHL